MIRRALIIANKWWEADPLVDVLSSSRSTPSLVRFIHKSERAGLRGIIEPSRGRIEIWCLQECMSPSKSGSSTEEKARVLPEIVGGDNIVLVVAFGTAATPTQASLNGSVVMGTNTFMFDPGAKDSTSHWKPPSLGKLTSSSLDITTFAALTSGSAYAHDVESRFIPVPLNPASQAALKINHDYVALADINVTNYADYVWADPLVVQAYESLKLTPPIGSLDTTHAVVRACTKAAFMFVSGITDRVGFFSSEVSPAPYGQNFVAAHNAALAVAFAIPAIASVILSAS